MSRSQQPSSLRLQRSRFDGYVRVSQVAGRSGERFMSPDLQRQQIERWASVNHAEIVSVYVELDESGANADRPLLAAALARVDAGESDGIVVARLDRFGRSLLDAMAMIQRIETAGGSFVSVLEGLDARTYIGRFALRILFSIAELELDRVRDTWMTAQARAADRGSYLPPRIPTGYVADELRRLHVDTRWAPVIRAAFQARVDGASYPDITRLLNDAAAPTPTGGTWTLVSTQAMLRNRAYLGEIPIPGRRGRAKAHVALVDDATWAAAQRGRAIGGRSQTEGGPASGLLRCAGCRKPMLHIRTSQGTQRRYECRERWTHGRCPQPASVTAVEVEHLLERAFFTVTARPGRPIRRDRSLAARVKRAAADLEAYRDHPGLLLLLGPERFETGIKTRLARLDRALEAVAADKARVAAQRSAATGADWELRWPRLPVTERRQVMSRFLDAAFVAGRDGPIERRFWAVARGRAPADLPQRRRCRAFRAFDPSEQPTVRIRVTTMRWSDERIARALHRYLDGKAQWPTESFWLLDGCGPLFRQLEAHGGRDAWARRIGMPTPWVPGPAWWTDERVRASIAEIMRTRDAWPKHLQWEKLGRGGLWNAVRPRNAEWARAFGYEPRGRPYREVWPDERIAATLLSLAGPGRRYPSYRDFEDAGVVRLYKYLARRRAHRLWAERLDLRPPEPQAGRHRQRTDWSDLNVLRHLLQAEPEGLTSRELARWLGDSEAAMRAAGRLRQLRNRRLCTAVDDPGGPRRWRAQVPANHPARIAPAPARMLERRDPRGERMPNRHWTKQEILDGLHDWADAHGTVPRTRDWKHADACHPTEETVRKYFGSWHAALDAAGFPPRHQFTPADVPAHSA